mmetsp:Transcript_8580/g.18801  ORF Transcript_8580/g.18801 Transcript_8580/m.18801 type:complete len:203 (+) Transcript_8580:1082-1690(+)
MMTVQQWRLQMLVQGQGRTRKKKRWPLRKRSPAMLKRPATPLLTVKTASHLDRRSLRRKPKPRANPKRKLPRRRQLRRKRKPRQDLCLHAHAPRHLTGTRVPRPTLIPISQGKIRTPVRHDQEARRRLHLRLSKRRQQPRRGQRLKLRRRKPKRRRRPRPRLHLLRRPPRRRLPGLPPRSLLRLPRLPTAMTAQVVVTPTPP